MFWGGWQWRFNGFLHNPVDYAADLQCPALFMHGADDPRARITDGRRVFDAAPGDKTFLEFQNTGHHSYVSEHRSEWTAAVETFMKKAESRAPQAAGGCSAGRFCWTCAAARPEVGPYPQRQGAAFSDSMR